MASFVARPGDWPARFTARLQPSGWAARSAKLLAALLMSQRLMCDVDMVEEQQLRQLEGDAAGGPPTLPESMAVSTIVERGEKGRRSCSLGPKGGRT